MAEPKLPIGNVPLALWHAVATAVRPTFADSYLAHGYMNGASLTPYTLIGYKRLKANRDAMRALGSIRLVQPLPFGHPDRPDTMAFEL